MSNTEEVSPDGKITEREALLKQYEKHRDEIRLVMRLQDKLLIRAAATIGVILGYSFVKSEDRVLLLVVPFVIGLFYIRHTSLSHGLHRLSNHVIEIENIIDIEGFDWESNEGILSEEMNSVRLIPSVALNTLLIIVYIIFVIASIGVVRTRPLSFQRFTIGPPKLLLFYLFYTSLLIAVGISNLLSWNSWRSRFNEETTVLRKLVRTEIPFASVIGEDEQQEETDNN